MMSAQEPDDLVKPGAALVEKRRMVVGLDTSFLARETLALAARLAASINARLNGVFVEDENLINLASLPFAREFSLMGNVRELNPTRMQRALQAQAESTKRVLARLAAEAEIDWSFDIKRGHPLHMLAETARAADTLVLRSQGVRLRDIGRTVRAATRDTHADVLLVSRGASLKTRHPETLVARPVAAIDEGTSAGESCYALGQALAGQIGAPFMRLASKGLSPADIATLARQADVGLLVVNADWLGDDDDAAQLSTAAGCPVLLLGNERSSIETTQKEGA
ncbi:MAG: hypothetical protein GC184_13095 [Rhizobiales bacterium]|nr:hypothetical protein [Hyphomicrobiales bacterium]